jgi:ATP-dependent Clp protease adaptor protein ClpS
MTLQTAWDISADQMRDRTRSDITSAPGQWRTASFPSPTAIAAGPDLAGPGPDDDRRDLRGPGSVDLGRGRGGEAATKAKPKVKKPSMYRVLLLNDDYTPMEFVVYVLERFFNKSREQATAIMLHVHQHGVGVCGVFSYEVAETKVAQVLDLARRNEHPLQCTMEKD